MNHLIVVRSYSSACFLLYMPAMSVFAFCYYARALQSSSSLFWALFLLVKRKRKGREIYAECRGMDTFAKNLISIKNVKVKFYFLKMLKILNFRVSIPCQGYMSIKRHFPWSFVYDLFFMLLNVQIPVEKYRTIANTHLQTNHWGIGSIRDVCWSILLLWRC